MVEVSDKNAIVMGPQLEAHRPAEDVWCPACGNDVHWASRLFARLRGGYAIAFNTSYCGGGKEIADAVVGIEAMITQRSERLNPCAGVNEPHLHCSCCRCGYLFLMRTKARIRV